MLTPYHAKYYAFQLTRRASKDAVDRYLPALFNARVELHPHQIDAALFAMRSLSTHGAVLCDEEGLGKTVEAGILLCQKWYEQKRRLLVIAPSSTVDQWAQELSEKFDLSTTSLEHQGDSEAVVLITYETAKTNAERLSAVPWDLVVLDDAHRLAGNTQEREILRTTLSGSPRLLLTATPVQKNLLDLYGLVTFVDDLAFGSAEAFEALYMKTRKPPEELAVRMQALCRRTLRRQALTMQFPKRIAVTQVYALTDEEYALHRRLSAYMHWPVKAAFPKVQEHYIRMTLYKLLVSSPQAFAHALQAAERRLSALSDANDELSEVRNIIADAEALPTFSRANALLAALDQTFARLNDVGAPRKALIFTESLQTQKYLQALLSQRHCIVLYNGQSKGQSVIDRFRDEADIMIATDSASEGLNLQFCALVVNYDLPYNVQRLEQRICRCHRYGQKHDVLVVNLINAENRVERRLYTLLNKRLQLMDELFGASESGLGDVRRADEAQVGDGARTLEQIGADIESFNKTFEKEITQSRQRAEADLLAGFDENVANRFKLRAQEVSDGLSQMEHWLWALTRYKLERHATFIDDKKVFVLSKSPYKGLRLSGINFGLDRDLPKSQRYRLDHPLAKRIFDDCLFTPLYSGRITVRAGGGLVSGQFGLLGCWNLSAMTSDDYETYALLAGNYSDGIPMSEALCQELLKRDVLTCQAGFADKDEETGQVYVHEILHESEKHGLDVPHQTARALLERRILLEKDVLLQEEIKKLIRRAQDDESAFERMEQQSADELATLKARLDEAGSFAERFALNKEVAVLEKRLREGCEARFLGLAAIQQEHEERMAVAKAQSTVHFNENEMFLLHWKAE